MILRDKVALITGGARGIGAAIVRHFAAEGAVVVFTYGGSQAPAEALAAELNAQGHRVETLQADARDGQRAQAVVDHILSSHGRIDVVVNNAGITRDNLLLRMSEQQWDEVLDTNLRAVFHYTKAATKAMMKQRQGVFVNIGSVVGIGGNAGQANYAASKAGLIGFTQSVAKELGSRNIRANVVAPGFIATEMTDQLPVAELQTWLKGIPLGRPGQAAEVAQLCAFLASDQAAYITGQTIRIDGGMG
jgi:3-oxoacyl-[acyl-carrier protein] reductase